MVPVCLLGTMLHYPKIPGSAAAPNGRCVAFEKLDGTNLHWCWERDFGWHAFGTRRDEFNLTPDGIAAFNLAHPGLEEAAPAFINTLAEPLDTLLREHPNYASFITVKVFTEFLGPNSFAGAHKPDDLKRLVLFDVWAEGYGFVAPKAFVTDFGHLPTPRVVYEGKLTGTFLEAVREGKYGLAEGVVCKGGQGGEDVWMVKVKTYAYLERLKKAFGTRWNEFWE
ncbi:RNA ligase family protein [Gemmata algarum]|uniref:RNA ligase family protein n=1 Tax=Gemmata algarum TaxID=2975278 RepID=UPI0039C99551